MSRDLNGLNTSFSQKVIEGRDRRARAARLARALKRIKGYTPSCISAKHFHKCEVGAECLSDKNGREVGPFFWWFEGSEWSASVVSGMMLRLIMRRLLNCKFRREKAERCFVYGVWQTQL